jgi:hypothetical protein
MMPSSRQKNGEEELQPEEKKQFNILQRLDN